MHRHTCWANSECTECRPTHKLWKVTGIALCLRLEGAGASAPSRWTLGRVCSHMPYSLSDKEVPTGSSGAGSRGCRLGKEGKQVLQQLTFTNVLNTYDVPGAV